MFRSQFIFILVLVGPIHYVSNKKIVFTKCKSEGGELEVLDVTPCPKQPCVFKKGTSISCVVTFTPSEEITSSTIELLGRLYGHWIPWHSFDGCEKSTGMSCPVPSGKTTTFNITINVPNIPGKLDLTVKIDMKDQRNKTNLCGEFDATLEADLKDF